MNESGPTDWRHWAAAALSMLALAATPFVALAWLAGRALGVCDRPSERKDNP